MTIRDELRERTGREFSFGAIYTTLQRLEADGLLSSHEGDPTPERGGRAKRFYELTGRGVVSLQEATSGLMSQVDGFSVPEDRS